MFKRSWLVTLFWASGVLAGGVDERFATGVAGVEWGATLEKVQAIYLNGLTYPVADKDNIDAFIYEVSGDAKMLGIEVPVERVRFAFTKDKKLHTVFFHFYYSQRESVLYSVAEALGQDYTTKDEAGFRWYYWKPGRSSIAGLSIGVPPYTWAYLAIRATANVNRRAE